MSKLDSPSSLDFSSNFRQILPTSAANAFAAEVGRLLVRMQENCNDEDGCNLQNDESLQWIAELAKNTGTPERTIRFWWSSFCKETALDLTPSANRFTRRCIQRRSTGLSHFSNPILISSLILIENFVVLGIFLQLENQPPHFRRECLEFRLNGQADSNAAILRAPDGEMRRVSRVSARR